MSARYAPLPAFPRSAPETDRELEDAFAESDNEDNDDDGHLDTESTPLTQALEPNRTPSEPPKTALANGMPGTYDFERDYDYPPPGSPPGPSALALPNDYGNSNGQMPSSPVRETGPRPSFFRRAVGAILPTHYTRVPVESSRARGGGIENDGVFANVTAKPAKARTVRAEDGSVHIVPEDNQAEAPPSYSDAQADAVPPYWETTVHAPSGLDPGADMIVDDLPSGSLFIFAANLFTSFFFQFIGFLLTYLLHTSHAAKYGSRAGLGLTLIQYGFYSRQNILEEGQIGPGGEQSSNNGLMWGTPPADASDPPLTSTSPPTPDPSSSNGVVGGVTSKEWLSFLLMTLGWFLLLSSFVGFWRIKRWEKSIRASSAPAPVSREDIERDIAVRRNIQSVFGFGLEEDEEEDIRRHRGGQTNVGANGTVIVIPDQQSLEEARLTRDLRAAGLL